jgi:hypothetical protein
MMGKKDIYTQWKEYRRYVPVPENFSDGVMAAIEANVPSGEDELPAGLTELSNRIARWGAAAGLVMLGIFRILYIAANLLQANPLMPY